MAEPCQGDRCVGYAVLASGGYLLSRNGHYKFIHQKDGNLEILCDGNKIWESHTKGKSADRFYIAKGGLALYDTDKKVIWQAGPWRGDTSPETVIMQNDGNFVICYLGTGNKRKMSKRYVLFSKKKKNFVFLSEKWLYDRVYYSQFHFLSNIFKMPLSSIEI